MPRDKDLKRLVRARMEKTGESYTTARSRIVGKTPKKTPTVGPAEPVGSPGTELEFAL